MKKIRKKIKCFFGYHEEVRTEENLGYLYGLFPTTKSTYTCKHCGHKQEYTTSEIF